MQIRLNHKFKTLKVISLTFFFEIQEQKRFKYIKRRPTVVEIHVFYVLLSHFKKRILLSLCVCDDKITLIVSKSLYSQKNWTKYFFCHRGNLSQLRDIKSLGLIQYFQYNFLDRFVGFLSHSSTHLSQIVWTSCGFRLELGFYWMKS